jgi:hypothetical protein
LGDRSGAQEVLPDEGLARLWRLVAGDNLGEQLEGGAVDPGGDRQQVVGLVAPFDYLAQATPARERDLSTR